MYVNKLKKADINMKIDFYSCRTVDKQYSSEKQDSFRYLIV